VKKDSPAKEQIQEEGAQEIKIEGAKWVRAPVKVLEPTF
jgi:ketopantoate hydroxymethyltransferase